MKNPTTNIFPLILACLFCTYSLSAQNLPNKQVASLRAPASIKIDGLSDEWKNQFQAYNNATQIYYTMANNNQYLFLLVKATNPLNVRKIIAGGITLTVKGVKEKYRREVAVTFPVLDKSPNINWKKNPMTTKLADNVAAIDSFRSSSNKELTAHAKFIKVLGVSEITDTVISVYNEHNIVAAGRFDKDISLTYELSIPLAYLKKPEEKSFPLNYSIQLNGAVVAEGTKISRPPTGGVLLQFNTRYADAPSTDDMLFISTPTSFEAQYTLSK